MATTIATVELLSTRDPPPGLWLSTVPGSWSDSFSETATRSPALLSVDSAAAWDEPITLGTVTCSAPVEMISVTVAPFSMRLPPSGVVPIARPFATESDDCSVIRTLKPAARSRFSASAWDWPSTVGTVASPGPSDTRKVTVEPLSTDSSGWGSWRITRSLGLSSVTRWMSTLKPAFSRTVEAVETFWPTTLGTETFSGRVRAYASTAAADDQDRHEQRDPRPPVLLLRRRWKRLVGEGGVRAGRHARSIALVGELVRRQHSGRTRRAGARRREDGRRLSRRRSGDQACPLGLERRDELVGVDEAPGRVLLDRVQHDRVELRRNARALHARGHRRLGDLLERDGDGAVAVEGHPAGEQLEEDDADGVEVGGRADRMPLRLLGREVLRRAHDRARLGHVRGAGAGDAEVRDLRPVLGVDDHVLGFEIAVDDRPGSGRSGPP